MIERDEAVAWEQRDGHGVANGGGGSIAALDDGGREPDAVAGGGEVAGRPGLGLRLGVNASPTNAVAPGRRSGLLRYLRLSSRMRQAASS